MTAQDNDSQADEVYHGECPGCEETTEFSKGGFGITCDSCGYLPRYSVREEIKNE